jgi:hypothetical protein
MIPGQAALGKGGGPTCWLARNLLALFNLVYSPPAGRAPAAALWGGRFAGLTGRSAAPSLRALRS